MSFVNKVVAIIYRSYDDRGQDIPHFRAIMPIVLIIVCHAAHFALLFDIPSHFIFPWSSNDTKSIKWLYALFYIGFLFALLSIFFKQSKLDKIDVSQKQIDRCRTILPVYLTLCMILLTVLLIKSGIENGKINL